VLLSSVIHITTLDCGSVTIKINVSTKWCYDMSRMNLSGYVGYVTIFSLMFTNACCLVAGLGLGLDLVSIKAKS